MTARPRLGTCWFPEQWPRARWETDVAAMADTGLELVRMGEFAWSWYAPRPGVYDFAGLDTAIGLVRDAGLGVVLCTPTATPPRWLTAAHPDVLSVGPDGARRAPGSRRHTCLTSATYRALGDEVTGVLGERYGDVVTAWQLDNEPGNHDSARCWCPECEDAFRTWVLAGHDLAGLAADWGTAFWSQGYAAPAEVELPRPTMTAQNPALELAHRRFASGQVVGFLARQRDALLAVAPDATTCTNEYADETFTDPAGVARLHGVAAIDSYPHGTRGPWHTAYLLDLARGSAVPAGADAAAHGGRAWVVEQQPGRINWTPHNAAVPPGQVRVWTWQALLHGIDTLLFFRWRAAVGGQEQYHAGLLRHDAEGGLGLHDAATVAGELASGAWDAVLAERTPDVALVVDHDARWALEIEQHLDGAGHDDLVLPAYEALRRRGLEVDVVPPDVDLTGYPLVVAPLVHLRHRGVVDRLLAALDAGAHVVVGARSLVRTADSGWVTEPAPAGLAGRLGARVVDAGAVGTWPDNATSVALDTAGGGSLEAQVWAEQLVAEADDVEVLVTHTDDWRAGAPAVVRRDRLVYVGAAGRAVWDHVVGLLVEAVPSAASTEVFRRGDATVVLDHAALTVELRPARPAAPGPTSQQEPT